MSSLLFTTDGWVYDSDSIEGMIQHNIINPRNNIIKPRNDIPTINCVLTERECKNAILFLQNNNLGESKHVNSAESKHVNGAESKHDNGAEYKNNDNISISFNNMHSFTHMFNNIYVIIKSLYSRVINIFRYLYRGYNWDADQDDQDDTDGQDDQADQDDADQDDTDGQDDQADQDDADQDDQDTESDVSDQDAESDVGDQNDDPVVQQLSRYGTRIKYLLLSKEADCAICLEDMEMNTSTMTSCLHLFHTTCLNECKKNASTCPVCREQL
jgi:hypothetical protein